MHCDKAGFHNSLERYRHERIQGGGGGILAGKLKEHVHLRLGVFVVRKAEIEIA